MEVVHSPPTALTTCALEYRPHTMWYAFGTLEHSRTFSCTCHTLHLRHCFVHLSSVSHYSVVVTETLLFRCIAIKLCCYATSKRRTVPIRLTAIELFTVCVSQSP